MTMLSRSAFLAAPLIAGAATGIASAQAAPLRVGATANDPYAEAYYAQDGGFFSKHGLRVEITTFPNGGPILTAVAGGSLDIGVTNPPELANAIVHEIPFVYFAGSALYSSGAPTAVMCVAANSSIRVMKDLVGKTIAVSSLKDGTNLAADAYLTKGGVDIASVKVIEMPFPLMGAALARGAIQAAVMSEPALTASIEAGQTRIFGKAFDAISSRFLISGWFTTSEWYKRNTAIANRFVAAMYETARWANANHDATATILLNHSKIDAAVAKKMMRCQFAETLDARLLDPVLALAARVKLTDRLVTGAEMIAKS
jgi:NitT/TauT family transport system substrate-binding protein